eukprot:125750-Hanusia_phi.AAC.1
MIGSDHRWNTGIPLVRVPAFRVPHARAPGAEAGPGGRAARPGRLDSRIIIALLHVPTEIE